MSRSEAKRKQDSAPTLGLSSDGQKLSDWLEKGFRDGTIESFSATISRASVVRFLDISWRQFHISAELNEIVARYDARLRQIYVSQSYRETLVDLDLLLASPECPTGPNGVSVSQLWLADALKRSPQVLSRTPFAERIEAKNRQLLADAKNDPIDPYFQGRRFRFSDCITALQSDFVRAVASQFKMSYENASSSGCAKAYLEIRRLLKYLGVEKSRAVLAVRRAVRAQRSIPLQAWSEVLSAFRTTIVGNGTQSYQSTRIGVLNLIIDKLAAEGIVPALREPLSGIRNASRRAGRVKSLAEAPKQAAEGSPVVDDHLDLVRSLLPEGADRLGVSCGGGVNRFLDALQRDTERCGAPRSENPEVVIHKVLQERLDAISAVATETIEKWMQHASEREALRPMGTIDAPSFIREYQIRPVDGRGHAAWLRRYFPAPPDDPTVPKVGLANLLALIEGGYEGVVPSDRDSGLSARLRAFLGKRYAEWGGIARVAAYLSPHHDVYPALAVQYLCESGANVAVARTLPLDCLQDSDDPGVIRVVGNKERAGGKAIYGEFRRDSLLIRAMAWVQAATRRLPGSYEAESLLIMRLGTRHQQLSETILRTWFSAVAEEHPTLNGLHLTPQMIRPSIILKHTLENDGRFRVGMAVAQHTEAVTQGYQNRWPTRLVYDRHVRAFQNSLEALVGANIGGAAERLGISETAFRDRIDTLQKTGFGTFCANALGRGADAQGEACNRIDCWNNCRQMIFVAQLEATVTVQLWQCALREAAPEWERDRPERWDEVWLPWLCLFDVIEEKMARGPEVLIWTAAKDRRATLQRDPSFVAPRPW